MSYAAVPAAVPASYGQAAPASYGQAAPASYGQAAGASYGQATLNYDNRAWKNICYNNLGNQVDCRKLGKQY